MRFLVASLHLGVLYDLCQSATVQVAHQVGFSSFNEESIIPPNPQDLTNQAFSGGSDDYEGNSGGSSGFDFGGGNGFSGDSGFLGGGNGLGGDIGFDVRLQGGQERHDVTSSIGVSSGDRSAGYDGDHTARETGEDSAQPYSFEYAINDEATNNEFGQRENSDGKTVKGRYYVKLPDGRKQTVDYSADHVKGFTSEVVYEGQATNQQEEYAGDQGGPVPGVLPSGQIGGQGGTTGGVVATGTSSQYATFPVAGQCMIFPGLVGQGQRHAIGSVPPPGTTGNFQMVKPFQEPTPTGPNGHVPVPTGSPGRQILVPSPDGQLPIPTGQVQGQVPSPPGTSNIQTPENDPLGDSGLVSGLNGELPPPAALNETPPPGSRIQLPTLTSNQGQDPRKTGQTSVSGAVTGINELPLEPVTNLGPNTSNAGLSSFPSGNPEPASGSNGQYPTTGSV